MLCKKCGRSNDDNSKFCSDCGEVNSVESVTTSPKVADSKKILGSIGSIVVFILVFVVVRGLTHTATTTVFNELGYSKTELTADVMEKITRELNKELPMMVDSTVRLDSTYGAENKLGYKYTLLNTSISDIEPTNLQTVMKPRIINGVCSSPEMSIYVRNKAIINYDYYDMYGMYIGTVSVHTGIDCLQ